MSEQKPGDSEKSSPGKDSKSKKSTLLGNEDATVIADVDGKNQHNPRSDPSIPASESEDNTIIRESSEGSKSASDEAPTLIDSISKPITVQKKPRASGHPPGPDSSVREPSQSAAVTASNDVTRVRGASDGDGSDNQTVLRDQMSAPRPASSSSNDVTEVRGLPERDQAGMKQGVKSKVASSDNQTVLRDDLKQAGGKPPTLVPNNTKGEASRSGKQAAPNDNATVVRDREELKEAAERARNSQEDRSRNDNQTMVRQPKGPSNNSATILRAPSADNATILRAPLEDATVMADADRTVVGGGGGGDDATVVASDGSQDTTYVAAVERSAEPKGNSEAGRLLKNRFVLEEKLGAGGMGDVYKALDLRAQEAQEKQPYVAIKLLNESFSRHKDAFISLQREASKTRAIPHPNIMGVFDFDREGDTYFMSMELLDGEPLDDYLRDHPEGVSSEDAHIILDGICKGLSRAHAAGIVHSDFKPGNIYYCSDKSAKVFDFGIARAVTSPLDTDGEKTVFDAGSLGALTPTYASYEMLTGQEPSKSDDVYALALVAYELFTGKHPYNRTPADKALDRGIKPEPIPGIKRRQWRALRKALALKGEDRTQTIDEFHDLFFAEDPPYFSYAAVAAVLVGALTFGFYNYLNPETVNQEFMQLGNLYQVQIDRANMLKRNPEFIDEDWHIELRAAINRATLLNGNLAEYQDDEEGESEQTRLERETNIRRLKEEALSVYLSEITDIYSSNNLIARSKAEVEANIAQLETAQGYLETARTYYNVNPEEIYSRESQLATAIGLKSFRLQEYIADEEAVEAARLAAEEAERQRLAFEEQIARRNQEYSSLTDEFREILKCKGDLSSRELDRIGYILKRLPALYGDQYGLDRPGMITALRGCIARNIGTTKPQRARAVQGIVLGFLPGEELIASIEVQDIDPCTKRGLEGRGNRSRRWCADQLSEGGNGPEMVVIPAGESDAQVAESGSVTTNIIEKFAISRTEIKVGDYNLYCENAGCTQLSGSSSLPVTNVSLEQAQAYIIWLNEQSGRDYRLPTVSEWSYAARPGEEVDDNINCTVESRGVRLGESLRNTESGKPNSWGLYNYVGNAQEWALSPESEGDSIFALGGAHTDPRAECSINRTVVHSGQADAVTGFRVMRRVGS